jgi:FkbM family methyltransferase
MSWLCRRSVPSFWARTSPEQGGHYFACDLRDSIAREVCFTHRYEPQETALLQSLLRPGMTFVDVGANWGYFTLLAAGLVGRGGRVVSLEPDPRLFALLRANLARNGLDFVAARQVAAADRPGTLHLEGFDEEAGNWGLSRLTDRPAAATFAVAACPVDALLDELAIDRIDLLKMDIEGAEDLALQGMQEGLKRQRYQRILLEVHPTLLAEKGRSVEDVFARLTGAGYRAWQIDHSPEATRQAAYARIIHPDTLLRSMEAVVKGDAWPHWLWSMAGLGPLETA